MKSLDRWLRAWRTRVAFKAVPEGMSSVLDIGCGDDGYLLRRLDVARRDGLDPALENEIRESGLHLAKGFFPDDLRRFDMNGPYHAIFSLAVFEHLDEKALLSARSAVPELLYPGGRLIVSVPHPIVDRILDVLMFLHLIDGQAVDEHHGFAPEHLVELASERLRLVARKTFQLGLNNLFVFERTGG